MALFSISPQVDYYAYSMSWRGGRVVECTALEMRHTRKGIGGSNPSLSAKPV